MQYIEIKSPLVVVFQTRSDACARRPSFLEANPRARRQPDKILQKDPSMMHKTPIYRFLELHETLNATSPQTLISPSTWRPIFPSAKVKVFNKVFTLVSHALVLTLA